ncbi:Gp49 family protein [Methylobacterium gossipiicola]|uniref:Phage protein (N4 Gp49/phage Sf6 gene 66) family protein n=1 Tax=Methylobacterium gossipiicola TaxID=582675 RepID=A0A1I2TSW4_9HYPH|nr:Gp49 family protein [Methylobacterium gossipiicola]SFG65451.1 Phage protein (N4 Gp49/phage Sf6 gene 66) family protein [Methylobacterium gossipiicola]
MVDSGDQARAFAQKMAPLPAFHATHVSHKHVEAYRIAAVECLRDGSGTVTLECGLVVGAPLGFATRGVPSAGDYLVRYEPTDTHPQGYLSHSPRAVFEAGYVAASRQPDGTGAPALTRDEADAVVERSTAPRVTADSITAKIAGSKFFRDGVLTICIITMRNGFTHIGKSACASPENYDQAAGERYAYDDAFRQAWAFEAYLLRETLTASAAERRGQDVTVEAPPSATQDTRSRGEPRAPRFDDRLPGGRPHP